ncbi:MAG: response regulator [Acidobacteriota bacterium]
METPRTKKVILVVEDAAASKEIFQIAIQNKDTELLVASDGAEGVRVAFDRRPDLILMDMMIPRLTGYQVAEQLKADPRTRHIPIVAVTARATEAEREKARVAGCDDFVAKPFRLGEIREIVAKFLG